MHAASIAAARQTAQHPPTAHCDQALHIASQQASNTASLSSLRAKAAVQAVRWLSAHANRCRNLRADLPQFDYYQAAQ